LSTNQIQDQPHASLMFHPDDPNRVIQSLWIGDISPLEWACMQSFVRCGHEFHLYVYDPIPAAPAGVVMRNAREILPAKRVFRNRRGIGKGSFAGFSDLFRYTLIYDRGGWWVDMDVFCLRPFQFSAPYVLGSEDKPVATGVIKAPRGCQLMRQAIYNAEQIPPASVKWNELGNVLGHAVADLRLMHYVLPSETFSPLVWHETPDYVRGNRRFTPSKRNYAVHLYHEMWRRNKIDKWLSHGPDSVLEILKKQANLAELADACPSRRSNSEPSWAAWLPWRRAA
jgi:hypothetical protein